MGEVREDLIVEAPHDQQEQPSKPEKIRDETKEKLLRLKGSHEFEMAFAQAKISAIELKRTEEGVYDIVATKEFGGAKLGVISALITYEREPEGSIYYQIVMHVNTASGEPYKEPEEIYNSSDIDDRIYCLRMTGRRIAERPAILSLTKKTGWKPIPLASGFVFEKNGKYIALDLEDEEGYRLSFSNSEKGLFQIGPVVSSLEALKKYLH